MEENYWKQFCSTGAVEDYLRYTDAREKVEEEKHAACKNKSISDRDVFSAAGPQHVQAGRLV